MDYEAEDKYALKQALLALRICPKCRADLRIVGHNGPEIDLAECTECRTTYNVAPRRKAEREKRRTLSAEQRAEVKRVGLIIELGRENTRGPNGEHVPDMATCGTCGRTWDDGRISELTPTPSARCPFEYAHN